MYKKGFEAPGIPEQGPGSLTQGSIPFIGSGGVVSQNNSGLFLDAVNSRLGIGTSAPSTSLHIKTGTANDGGLRMENLTSSSTVTTGAAVLGVDATGKVVRAKTPLYYSGNRYRYYRRYNQDLDSRGGE